MVKQNSIELTISDIEQAHTRIRSILPITPLTHSPSVSDLVGHDVYFKWDNKLKTGSFKERGAVNFLLSLTAEQRKRGVCAASAGNHALALSYHAARLGIPCYIVMPVTAPLIKIQSTESTGAKVTLFGNSFSDTVAEARRLSEEHCYVFAHAFEDLLIMAGQGTCGIELLHQLPDLDAVVVPVGGGGFLAGISTVLKSQKRKIYIQGVQSQWAVEMRKSGGNNNCSIPPSTIADGIAVKVMGENSSRIVEKNSDSLIALTESEIAKGIIGFLELERTVVEGAGSAGLSAILKKTLPKTCKKSVVVVTGSNIDTNLLSRLIDRDMEEKGRLLRINVSVPDRPGSLNFTSGILAKLRANVLQVYHDRSSSLMPGNVDIAFLLEVRDSKHKQEVISSLEAGGISVQEVRVTHQG